MKKILKAIALIVCLVFPLSAMAMTAIQDNDLSTVTGQAGVSINLDVNMGLNVDTIAWGDKDGLGATSIGSGAGWIGLKSLSATGIRIRLRTDLLANDWTIFMTQEPLFITTAVLNPVGASMTGLGALPAPLAEELSANFNIANIHTYTNQNVGVYLVYAAMGVAAGPGLPVGLSSNFNIQNPATWTAGDFALLAPLDASGMITAGYNLNVAAANLTGTLAVLNAGDGIAPLTIDVATDTTTGHGVANTTFVRIGTGSLEIQMATLGADVKLGTGTTPTLNQELGSIYLGNLDVNVNGTSYVDIYNGRASNLQGVTLGFSVTIDKLTLGTLSWTDRDGFVNGINGTAGTANTGYGVTASGKNNTPYSNTLLSGSVGLINTDIETLTVAGALTIDVATDTTTGHGGVANTTFVHLGFANTKIGMATLDTTAVLGPEKTLTYEVQTLGSIYMAGLAATVSGYADIYAHAASGVSIDFNAAVGVNMDEISWGDINGVGSTATAGYVGLRTLAITGLGLSGNATIDVATVMSGDTASSIPLGTTFVQIGVNHLSVNLTSMTADVVMDGNKTLRSANAQTLGSLYMGGMTTNLNGTIDIYSPNKGATVDNTNTTGVVIALNLLPTDIHIDAISWGDGDGFGTTAAAGYVGLKTLDITGLTVAGKVSIDVATVDGSVLPTSLLTLMYAGYPTHHLGYYTSPLDYASTFVHIGLGTGNGNDDTSAAGSLAIHLATMATDVGLASAPNLATATNFGTLGSIYVGNMTAKVNGWVDIAAH